ncbi:MAG TPA: hypothetical protein VK824_08580, partial [Planctomycetota bacterium]|nr:hypothetical protein [Planctomycetota bacterium]
MRARSRPSSVSFHALPLLGLLALGACTLEPAGTGPEFRRLDLAAGAGGWQQPREDRALPDLPDPPSAEDVVARALLANGALEADWHAWRAALERVLVASGWPNTDLALGLTRFLEHGGVWDTSAVSLGFDPMQMLLLPDKVRQAGEVAFREALAAGRRFESSRVALRERALLAWWDWALLGEKLVVQERRVALLDALQRSA